MTSSPDPASRIIVPLDVPGQAEAIALVERLPQVEFWKVGLELFIAAGPEILAYLQGQGKRVFLDLKLHDIPNTVAGACRSASRYGVELLTLHAAAGKQALQQAVEAVATVPNPPKLLGVTLLTSLGARDLAFDLHVAIELPEYILNLALLARDAGLNGAVCSPQEATQLRDICGRDFLLVCPGIRPTFARTSDQQRVMTPAAAMAAGADYLVIGRPITAAANPEVAWKQICAEMTGLG